MHSGSTAWDTKIETVLSFWFWCFTAHNLCIGSFYKPCFFSSFAARNQRKVPGAAIGRLRVPQSPRQSSLTDQFNGHNITLDPWPHSECLSSLPPHSVATRRAIAPFEFPWSPVIQSKWYSSVVCEASAFALLSCIQRSMCGGCLKMSPISRRSHASLKLRAWE